MRTLLTAGAIRTAAGIVGDAVLVEDRRILAVGSAETLRSSAALERSHPRAVIVPGLADSHLHPTAWAARRALLDVSAAGDLAGVLELVGDRARTLPPGAPVVGFGLDEERLAEGRLPDRILLDHADRPVVLTRICGHVAVANTAALDLAGLGPSSPDPPGGSLGRDGAGLPDGILAESAVGLMAAAVDDLGPDPDPESLLAALSDLVAAGITRVDAVASTGRPLWCGSGSELDLLLDVAAELPLDVRVLVVAAEPADLVAAADRLRRSAPRLSYLGWKGFADGSLGARTAALAAPYADAPGSMGMLRLDPDEAIPLLIAVAETAGVAALHGIGDAAVAATLDLFAAAESLGLALRHRIEHASVLSPTLVRRLAETGATASIQPGFVPADAGWIGRRLGSEREAWAYPFRSLRDAGVPMIAGSDAPVTPPDPWAGMTAAVHRAGGEALTPADAFALYASDLHTGSPADLVIVDRDPVLSDVAPTVLGVWKDGRQIPTT